MKPSLRAILWNDWPSLAAWIGLLITWMLYLGSFVVQRPTGDAFFLWLAAINTVMLLALLAWRVWRVYVLFVRGIAVQGQITGLWIVGDRGRVEFSYQISEERLMSWAPVHKTSRVLTFSADQSICVLLSRTNPRQAIVKELYT
jgi:hypothetical protein